VKGEGSLNASMFSFLGRESGDPYPFPAKTVISDWPVELLAEALSCEEVAG